MNTSVQVTKILVIDHAGNGFNILTTHDDVTWLAFRRRPFNAYLRDLALERMQRQWPAAEVRNIVDFDGRIPEDWLKPGARVI